MQTPVFTILWQFKLQKWQHEVGAPVASQGTAVKNLILSQKAVYLLSEI